VTTADLVSELEAKGVVLTACGDELAFDAPQGVMTPDLKAELAGQKREVLSLLRQVGHYGRWAKALVRLVSAQQPRQEELLEGFDERVGVLEYEAGWRRHDAEEQAFRLLCGRLDVRRDGHPSMI
jgi:hypothetical protein